MQVELLGLLLLQPERAWTLDEVRERLHAPPSPVHRELHRLVDAGIAIRDARRRPHSFRAATEAPAGRALRDLLELTTRVPNRLARALSDAPGIVAAAIHGSWAAGQVRPDSDLDVIVVTDGDRRTAQGAVRHVVRLWDAMSTSLGAVARGARGTTARSQPVLTKILHGPRIDIVVDLLEIGSDTA